MTGGSICVLLDRRSIVLNIKQMKLKKTTIVKKFLLYAMSLMYLILWGCTSTSPKVNKILTEQKPEKTKFVVPPGIDSTLARKAFIEAKSLFVSKENEKIAKSEIIEAKQAFEIYKELETFKSLDDSCRNKKSFIDYLETLEIPLTIKTKVRLWVETEDSDKVLVKVFQENYEILLNVKEHYEKAYYLNPFDVIPMVELSQVYTLLGKESERKKDSSNYFDKASTVSEKVLKIDRGNHLIYYRFGENYFIAGAWEKSNENFRKAYELLHAFSFFPENINDTTYTASIDSVTAFKYLKGVIQTYIKLYDSQNALKYIKIAETYTQSDKNINLLNEYKKIIKWADGNILARELFIEAERLKKERNHFSAARKFHEILDQTRSLAQIAYQESSLELSIMEYQHLMENEKYVKKYGFNNIGMNRLNGVVKLISRNEYGIPKDSTNLIYFNTLGTMLFNEGIKALKENHYVKAFSFFQQGALLYSSMQGKCCLELAKLTMKNGPIGLRWALKTYCLKKQLSEEELFQLYKLLRLVTKRSNNPVLCRYFNEEFRACLNKVPPSHDLKTETMAYEFLRSGYNDLDKYVWNSFRIKQDPQVKNKYALNYTKSEELLSEGKILLLREEIDKIYQKLGDANLYQDWKNYLQELKKRNRQ